jgi:hypothetical protein
VKPRAWIRPLKDGCWQFFACYRVDVMPLWGAARNERSARREVREYMRQGGHEVSIEVKRPYGKWAV